MSQTASRHLVAANRLIDGLLKTVLDLSPGAARVRLALIRHETERLRYDVTNSVALRGRWLGPVRSDEPLSDWSDFLPALLAGQCVLHRVLDVRSAAPAFGFPSSRPSTVLVCPAGGADGHLVGAIFVVWDGDAQPPEGAALRSLMAEGKRVATQIAAVLDLCGEVSRRVAEAGRAVAHGRKIHIRRHPLVQSSDEAVQPVLQQDTVEVHQQADRAAVQV